LFFQFIGRGHRRANTANSPIEIHNNSPQKSTTIAQSKPSSLIFNQTGNTQQIPHHILDSPLSEDEFFDAIDELTASFDQAEENKEHNKEISKKLLLQNPAVLVRCGTSGKNVDRKDFLPECNRKKIPHVFSTI